MRWKRYVSCATIVASSLLVAQASAHESAQSCKPGATILRGDPVIVHCGPATATVRALGRTITFTGGRCRRTDFLFDIELGIYEEIPHRYKYFGLGKKAVIRDGVYKRNVIAEWHEGGGRFVIFGVRLVLTDHRSRGRFTGKLGDGKAVSGSFRC